MHKRMLFVIHKLDYGGAPKIMAFLANSFAIKGDDVHLLTYEDMAVKQRLGAGVKHIGFPKTFSGAFFIRRIAQIFLLRNLLKQLSPDVVISFLPYPNMISILASRGMHIPVIISQRGDPAAMPSWFTKLRDSIYDYADGYVFQTKGAMMHYNAGIQQRAIVIPNPVVIESIPPKWTGSREDIIVHVGRFELHSKRQDILIHAFAKIAGKYPHMKLVLFGDGRDEQKIRTIINDASLQDRVLLPGVTQNICEAIKKARIFVLSSDNEGIPNALIEAMYSGLPCISTDCTPGGAATLIRNMENGLLVKAGYVDDLARAMEFMLANPDIAERMGQNALAIRNELDPERILELWDEYIGKWIGDS